MPAAIDLSKELKYFRTGRSSGKTEPKFDKAGGTFGAGIIRDVSLITRGESLGHGGWIDQEFLKQVSEAAMAFGDSGVKSRFTHPGMSSDGLGKNLGRINNIRLEGDQVIGDLNFSKSSHNTPDGDLAAYVFSLVEEDPKAAGLSIVFMRDEEAEIQFLLDHGAKWDRDSWGDKYLNLDEFASPDPANNANLFHFRLKELRASDLVDEPAANPSGMFDSMPVARNIDKALAYALGLETEKPNVELFGVNVDRAAAFVGRFLQERNLKLSTTTQTAAPEVKTDGDGKQTREEFAAELSKFTSKFGAENGSKWFSEGKSFSEALELHCEAQTEQLKAEKAKAAELQTKIDSLALGELKPLETGSTEPKKDKPKGLGALIVPEEAK